MHPASLAAFQKELSKLAQDHIDDAHEEADSRKKVLRTAATGAGAIAGAGVAKHYAKKGFEHVKSGITDAVHEGVKRGTKGAFWNALKLK